MQPARQHIVDVVTRALAEDVGPGDLTTELTIPQGTRARGELVARQALVVSGLRVADEVFAQVGGLTPRAGALGGMLRFEALVESGAAVEAGTVVGRVEGDAGAILTGERVALNFLMRLSGIATYTRKCVEAIAGTRARVVDTRKTTPGLRALEKAAVAHGGGTNHRFALFDGILVKDNHIRAAGGIAAAVRRIRDVGPYLKRIEVEAATLDDVQECLDAGVDAILLDNMSLETLRAAVTLCAGRAQTEASGGVTLANLREVAETGVDAISLGALTHSAPAADLALDLAL